MVAFLMNLFGKAAMNLNLDYQQVDQALAQLRLATTAAELHGATTGWMVAGAATPMTQWLSSLGYEANANEVQNEQLRGLFEASAKQLTTQNMSIDLLLPDDDASIQARGSALQQWVDGFLSGFGLAPSALELGEDAQEALQDLYRLAGVELDYDEDEGDEAAFAELVEFVKVTVLLLQAERWGKQPTSDTKH